MTSTGSGIEGVRGHCCWAVGGDQSHMEWVALESDPGRIRLLRFHQEERGGEGISGNRDSIDQSGKRQNSRHRLYAEICKVNVKRRLV